MSLEIWYTCTYTIYHTVKINTFDIW